MQPLLNCLCILLIISWINLLFKLFFNLTPCKPIKQQLKQEYWAESFIYMQKDPHKSGDILLARSTFYWNPRFGWYFDILWNQKKKKNKKKS